MSKINHSRVYDSPKILTSPTNSVKHTKTLLSKEHFTTDELLKECILEAVDKYFDELTACDDKIKYSLCDEIFSIFQTKCQRNFKLTLKKSFAKLCQKFNLIPRSDIEIVIYPNGTYKLITLE